MNARLRFALAAAAGSLAAACSLLSNFSGLTGADGGQDANHDHAKLPPVDAGSDRREVGSVDARSDRREVGSGLDAADVLDAPRDAPEAEVDAGCHGKLSSAAEAGCVPVISAGVGGSIPYFNGIQIVDGVGDEFCGYPAVDFNASQGVDPTAPDSGLTSGVDTTVHLAWSESGLHLHVHVDEAAVRPAGITASPWQGDAFELFAAATPAATGAFGPTRDPALQVIVSPPSGSLPTRSQVTTWLTGSLPDISSCDYAARLVTGGYEVEMFLPWSTLAGHPVPGPEAGTHVSLDLAADIHARAADGGRGVQIFACYDRPDGGDAGCPAQNPQPFCDDRTWCRWTLSPPN